MMLTMLTETRYCCEICASIITVVNKQDGTTDKDCKIYNISNKERCVCKKCFQILKCVIKDIQNEQVAKS